MRQTFAIDGRLDGFNEYIKAAHNAHARSEMKKRNEGRVAEAAARLRPMRAPVEITITYYEGKTHGTRERVRDLDNVIGGGNKFILDALVGMGILPNDDHKTVTRITAKGYLATAAPRILVELAEIGE